jgi:beta-phosphoglucomutase-like phosphatase (HAD superfamily)
MTDIWRIDAVLLDMDGTLLDTEPSYVSALTAALDAFGYPDARATCHALIGIPGAECEALETREKCVAVLPDLHAVLAMLREKSWRA